MRADKLWESLMAIINGTNGHDTLTGTAGADTINLFGGNDIAYGGGGNDVMIGFDGNDTLAGGAGADEIFGSAGFDFASYLGSSQGVVVNLASFYVAGGHAEGDQLYSIEGVIGSAFADQLVGGDGRNVLRGEGGSDALFDFGADDDLLVGGGGNDLLFGGLGADELRGGAGIDTASYARSMEAVLVDLAAGRGVGGEAEGDRLFGIENLVGTRFGDQLAGNSGANVLNGYAGADVLLGRGGADRFDYDHQDFSNPKAPDRILDFSRAQGDRIDLADIDANLQVDGNQAFSFIGQGPFTGAGQLRCYQQGGFTYVEANTTDAIGGAEMVILLDGLITLRGGDFLL
jgi:Ca2+-binding RTX toxin-like protein